MGLFNKPIVTCSICGREVGAKEKRWNTKDGFLCPDCQKPFGRLDGSKGFVSYDTKQLMELRDKFLSYNTLLAENKKTYLSLDANRIIENTVFIDDKRKKWYYDSGKKAFFYFNDDAAIPPVFNFEDVLEVSIASGEKTISAVSSTKKLKGIRKAAVGGLIAGAPGALLGGIMAESKTSTHVTETQDYFVNVVIDGEEEILSMPFPTEQSAEKVKLALATMINDSEEIKKEPTASTVSIPDEIRKFKELLDDGIITQEEFDTKKKQLLGL